MKNYTLENKMKKQLFSILFLTLSATLFGQSSTKIDSINALPFEKKLEKATQLIPIYLQNARNSKKINYKLGEAESYSNLSLVYYYKGNYKNDVYYSLQAIKIYETSGQTDKLALEYGELGYRMKKRNLVKALYYMQKAKKSAEKNKLEKPLLSIYNNYGVLKEMQHSNDSALYFYQKGLSSKEKIKDSVGIPYSLNNIAGVYVLQNKLIKAKELYYKSLKIRNALKDQIGITECYTYLGDLFAKQKLYLVSNENYSKALHKSIFYKYNDLIQYCYQKIAQNYDALNNPVEAYFNFKKYTQYKDSLLNVATNSKIAELEIQFETNNKEKLLLEKENEAKQKTTLLLGLLLVTFLIIIVGYLIYRQQRLKNNQQEQEFKLKCAIKEIESQNKLQEQRLSISRDLHDNIGAQLTFIISSVDNVKYGFDIKNDKLNSKLATISGFAKDTIIELRDTIWAMNYNQISFEDLEIRINNFIEKAKDSIDKISFSFAVSENLKTTKLTSVQGMNIYRTIQEAINNSIKYANATIISITIKEDYNKIVIIIKDNGLGFNISTVEKGNGLKNMNKRIIEIGGILNVISNNEGTKIEIII